MPLVIRGKKKTKNSPAGGTRRYADKKSQFWDRYELTSVKKRGNDYFINKTKIDICVYCKNTKGKCKKTGRKAFAFAYYGIKEKSASWLFETYRTRFGIESSYRQSHQCRIRTSTKSALLRLFYFALSMFLRNLWISFEREVILGGTVDKQKTSRYYGFDDFRNEIQKKDAKFSPILRNNK
jgi:putative transposase